MNEAHAYIARNFPDVLPGAAYNLLSEGTKRTAQRNVRIFDSWLQRNFPNQVRPFTNEVDAIVTLDDRAPFVSTTLLTGFMLYRVAGERLSSDIHSGSVALATFMQSDLSPMLKLLAFQGRVDFSAEEFRKSADFRDALITCRKMRGEVTVFSSARPIYPQDEARLRSCLSMDTASKRDEALLVLALRSGFRTESISLVRLDIHLYDISPGVLEIIIPGCKTTRLMDFRLILVNDDHVTVSKWIHRRRQIFPHSPYLFVTSKGTRVSCDSVTMMLSDLSISAGYGRGFFSSHSLRVGYASRIAAEGFSRNEPTEQVYERLCDGKRWSRRSKSVSKYIDPNVKSFFTEGLGMTLEEFFESCPALVHSLTTIDEPCTRPLTWFHTSDSRLLQIGRMLGLRGQQNQAGIRLRIAQSLFSIDSGFREFVNLVEESSNKKLGRILGIRD